MSYQVRRHSNLLDVTGSKDAPAFILHVVNDRGYMGKGIAKQIRAQWPVVYEQYRTLFGANHLKHLGVQVHGSAQGVVVAPFTYVCNVFAMEGIATKQRPHPFRLHLLQRALLQIGETAQQKHAVIHVPYGMGAGLAGGDWREIEWALTACSIRWHIDVIVHQWP